MDTEHHSNKRAVRVKRGKLGEFIFVHKKWISFLGLLIVLSTYVAKETLLEQIKANVDSIDTARKQFELEEQSLLLRKDLFQLKGRQNTPIQPSRNVKKTEV